MRLGIPQMALGSILLQVDDVTGTQVLHAIELANRRQQVGRSWVATPSLLLSNDNNFAIIRQCIEVRTYLQAAASSHTLAHT